MINLKAHFKFIMENAQTSIQAQEAFFRSFKETFNIAIETFEFEEFYDVKTNIGHLLTYSINDKVSASTFTEDFLKKFPEIVTCQFDDISHERMHKDPRVLNEIISFIKLKNALNLNH